MKQLLVMLLIALAATTMTAQLPIEGAWNTGKENTIVVLKKIGDNFVGTVLSSDNGKMKIGKKLIRDLQYRKGEWQGELYAPKKDKWVDATFEKKGTELVIKIGSGIRSKKVVWKEVRQ